MKKSTILLLVLSILLTTTFFGQVQASNKEQIPDIEQIVREKLKSEVEFMEQYIENEKVEDAVQKRYSIDENGNVKLEIGSIAEFAEETGLSTQNAARYIKNLRVILNEVNKYRLQYSKNTLSQDGAEVQSQYSCGEIEEIVYQFEYKTYYCQYQVEKILDNLSSCSYWLGGIALIGAKNLYLSVYSGAVALACATKYDLINDAFRDSGYHGVIHHVIEIPLSTNISEWDPWY